MLVIRTDCKSSYGDVRTIESFEIAIAIKTFYGDLEGFLRIVISNCNQENMIKLVSKKGQMLIEKSHELPFPTYHPVSEETIKRSIV